jgi:hypothetical protein
MARTRAVTQDEVLEAAGDKILKDFTQNTIMVLMPIDLYKVVVEEALKRDIQPVAFLREAVKSYIGPKEPV